MAASAAGGCPELSIVIVSWNVRECLSDCLESIAVHAPAVEHEVIVVDNASCDDSVSMLRAAYPRVRVVENDQNRGFSVACNQGVAVARGAFVLFLNPDARVTAGCIDALLAAIRGDPSAGLAGPMIRDRDGSLVRASRRPTYSLWNAFRKLFLIDELASRTMRVRDDDPRYAESGPTGCLQGSCLMARRADLTRLGGFDERVPLYLDDIDLCLRYRRAGYTVHYEASALVIHAGARAVEKLPNPRVGSLVGYIANDVYFYQHFGCAHVLAHHAMLASGATLLLLVDLALSPVLLLVAPRVCLGYLGQHAWMWIYGLTFAMAPSGYPSGWPRSFWRLLEPQTPLRAG